MANLVPHFVKCSNLVIGVADAAVCSFVIFLKFAQFWPFLGENVIHTEIFWRVLAFVAVVYDVFGHKILKLLLLLNFEIKWVHVGLETLFYDFEGGQVAVEFKFETIYKAPGIFYNLLSVTLVRKVLLFDFFNFDIPVDKLPVKLAVPFFIEKDRLDFCQGESYNAFFSL